MKKLRSIFPGFTNSDKWTLSMLHGKWSTFLFLPRSYTETSVTIIVCFLCSYVFLATRNQWARDDPAFMILFIPWMFGT